MIARCIVLAVIALLVTPVEASAALPVRTSVVRLSGPSPFADADCGIAGNPDWEWESSITVDPSDPNRMAAAWLQDEGRGIVVASTRDGGRSWTTAQPPGVSTCTGGTADLALHPRLTFAHDGTLLLASHPTAEPGSPVNEVLISRSLDGGETWGDPTHLEAPVPAMNDFDWISVEPDVPGAVDVVWSSPEAVGEPVWLSRSTDGGVTWEKHLVRFGTPSTVAMNSVTPLSDGTLLVFSHDYSLSGFVGGPAPISSLMVARSEDKGESWGLPQRLAEGAYIAWPQAVETGSGIVHVSYRTLEDARFTVWTMSSVDSGRSWTKPREAFSYSQGGTTVPEPTMAASGDALALFYYDHEDDVSDDQEFTITPRLAISRDQGATWEHTALAEPFDHATVPYGTAPMDGGLGFFQGLAGTPCGFVASMSLGGAAAEFGPTDLYAGAARLPAARSGSEPCNSKSKPFWRPSPYAWHRGSAN